MDSILFFLGNRIQKDILVWDILKQKLNTGDMKMVSQYYLVYPWPCVVTHVATFMGCIEQSIIWTEM